MTFQTKDQGYYRIYNSRNSQVNLLVLGDACYDWHHQVDDNTESFLTISRRPNPNGNSIWQGKYELSKQTGLTDDQLELFESIDAIDKFLYRLPQGLPTPNRQRTPILPLK